MQRKTYALINGDTLTQNVLEIKKQYPDYEYYFGVVKNNAYHHGMKCVLDLIRGGVNYLAVSSLEEALQVRKYTSDTPILCLEPIDLEYLLDAINNEITVTIDSLEYAKEVVKLDLFDLLKVHLAVDSGMKRLGFTTSKDFKEAYNLLRENPHVLVEGVFSHFATSGIMDPYWDKQVDTFLEITKDISLEEIPIVHFGRSLTLVNHEKLPFCNGIRLGIILYGFAQNMPDGHSLKSKFRIMKRRFLQKKYHCSETRLTNSLQLKTAMELYSTVMSVRKVHIGDVVGYTTYKVKEEGYILTLPIGYADGVTRDFQEVYVKGKFLPIVADCMDMLLVFSPEKIAIGTEVEIFGAHIPISKVCFRIHTNAYHLFNQISHRVVRIHVHGREKEEIFY